MKIHRINAATLLRSTIENLVVFLILGMALTVFDYLLDLLSKQANPDLPAFLAQRAAIAIVAVPIAVLIAVVVDWSCWLSTSPDGIQYHSILYQVSSSWENLQAIARHKPSGISLVSDEHLHLKDPVRLVTRVPAWVIDRARASTTMPLSSIQFNWRSTELGDELRRYAPHLF
jgi:hypothetical protein